MWSPLLNLEVVPKMLIEMVKDSLVDAVVAGANPNRVNSGYRPDVVDVAWKDQLSKYMLTIKYKWAPHLFETI